MLGLRVLVGALNLGRFYGGRDHLPPSRRLVAALHSVFVIKRAAGFVCAMSHAAASQRVPEERR